MTVTVHASNRLHTRFGLKTKEDYNLLKMKAEKEYELIKEDKNNGVETRRVWLNGHDIDLIISPYDEKIITATPPNLYESVVSNITHENLCKYLQTMLERLDVLEASQVQSRHEIGKCYGELRKIWTFDKLKHNVFILFSKLFKTNP